MQDSGEWRRARRQTLFTWSSLHTAREPNLHRPDRAQGSAPSGPAVGADRRCELVHCSGPARNQHARPSAQGESSRAEPAGGPAGRCKGERLTASHAVKKGRRYRYYVSAALITEARTDRAQGWRLAAREIEEAVIKILADALTSPAKLVEPFGAASMPSDQIRKLLNRAARLAAALGGLPDQRAKLVRELVEKITVDEKTIIVKLQRGALLGGDVPSSASAD